MGGFGSGRRGIGDAEKRRRGTYRPENSDAALAERAGAKVVTGPWLPAIPEPDLPLNEIGRRKYDELAKSLFDQNKLTTATRDIAQQIAILHQGQYELLSSGKPVRASMVNEISKLLDKLKIAEDAPTIENPHGKINKFSGCGFSNRRDASVRLQGSGAA
jgi:hypothetical protein